MLIVAEQIKPHKRVAGSRAAGAEVVEDGLDYIKKSVLPCVTYEALCNSDLVRSHAVAHEVAH